MPSKQTSKTTEAAPAVEAADHDRVVAVSIRADGTPDQTPDFEIIGDKETAKGIARRQFSEIAVAKVDADMRPPAADDQPSTDELRKAQESAIDAAKKKAESLVEAHHKG